MPTAHSALLGASAPIPFPTTAMRPGWTVKRLSGDRAQIIAHRGLRVVARDVRLDEANQIVQSANAYDELVNALRDAAGWLESIGQVHKIGLAIEGGERARATLLAVQS